MNFESHIGSQRQKNQCVINCLTGVSSYMAPDKKAYEEFLLFEPNFSTRPFKLFFFSVRNHYLES